jgi:hypothetical protein
MTKPATRNLDTAAKPAERLRRPLHPLLVLAVAILLPGVGQLLNGSSKRALMFLFSMMSLGWVSYHLTTPDHSFVGRYAGGFFVYAVSLMDAYRFARLRWEIFHRRSDDVPRP